MSVGFVGSSYQSIADSTGSGARLDASLQGVLGKYDSIKTDLDRLVDNASYNVYDITSRQQYNAYNKESQNNWSESWYSEYRAVLQMRADALKKKLSGSYNRVLEKSVYAEIAPDNQSVFAPYANRTASLTQVDYQTPVSEILVKDVAIGSVATVAPPALPSVVSFDSIASYLLKPDVPMGSPTSVGPPILGGPTAPNFTTPITASTVNPATGKHIFSTIPSLADAQYEAFCNSISDSFRDSKPPIPDPPITNSDKLRAKTLTDSIISALVSMSGSTTPLPSIVPATFSLMNSILPYAQATMVKSILSPISPSTASTATVVATKPISLPPSPATTIAGYQPSAYYDMAGPPYLTNTGTYVPLPPNTAGVPNWPPTDLFPLLVPPSASYKAWIAAGMAFKGVYLDATIAGAVIKTPSQPQDQNNTLTGNGYLFDASFPAGMVTISGTDSTGAVATLAKASVFSLTTPIAPPAVGVGTDPTTGLKYNAAATLVTDFIPYGTTPTVTTYFVDDLLPDPNFPTVSDIGAHICSLHSLSPGVVIALRTRFPLDWYIGGDPRLGVKGGQNAVTGGTFTTYTTTGTAPGTVYDFIDRMANPSQSMGGLYNILRGASGISMPTPSAPGPGITTPPATLAPKPVPPTTPVPSFPNAGGPSVTYSGGDANGSYQKAIGNAELMTPANYNNPRVLVPQFGTGVVDLADVFSGLPASVRDTMINNPDIMASLKDTVNSMVNSFVGRQYDDTVQGNLYAGQFDCSNVIPAISITPGIMTPPSGLDIVTIADRALTGKSSLLFAGAGAPLGLLTLGTPMLAVAGFGPDVNYGHFSAVNSAGSFAVPIPTVGVASMGFNIPIPIEIPSIPPFTIWAGMGMQKTRDVAAEFIETFLAAIKPLVVEALQTQAYSASGGTAFDTYASRGEYHFSNPGYLEAMKKLKFNIGPIEVPIGDMLNSFVKGGGLASLVSMGNSGWGANAYGTDVNGVSAGTRLFDYQQSIQGAENKETDAGGFFATQSFLSQFQMKNMESEYWIGTQQNEEVMNNDMLRSLQTAGGQIMGMMTRTLAAAASIGNPSPLAGLVIKVLVDAIEAMNGTVQQKMWYKMLYGDINYQGYGFGQNGWIKGEGYDYVEPDHKPFEGDSDFNYPDPPPQNLGTMVAGIFRNTNSMFSAQTPPFVMDGYSATMRFRKANAGAGAVESISTDALTPTDPTLENGYGARSHAGRGSGSPSGTDMGFWRDTALGDINEVYVGKRKVVFNNLDYGFGSFAQSNVEGSGSTISNTGTSSGTNITDITNGATRKTYAFADRYTGADTRAYGKRYDGGTPINFESFNTGLYSTETGVGSRYHYDRRNEYSLSFQTSASNNVVNLQGSQALNPSIGGFIKLAEIDKNNTDEGLLDYEGIDRNTLSSTYMTKTTTVNNVSNLAGKIRNPTTEQKFGGAADGTLNEFNKILYEAMHLRADGRNLSEFNEYRDVFNMGFMKNFFVSGQSYHPSGGGVTSSLEIRYDSFSGANSVQGNTRENYDSNANFDPYNTLSLNKSRGKASIYLNNYFAYKKRANKK